MFLFPDFMWSLGALPEGFPAAYAAYAAAGRGGYSGYPSFGLPYPTGNNLTLVPAYPHHHHHHHSSSSSHHHHPLYLHALPL
ncbi:hypothetical protein WDU94_003414 [Cyamophila willieti]